MILVLLDEPGWFLYPSAKEATRAIEPVDIAESLRAAFDETGQPYVVRWLPGHSDARPSESYDLVAGGVSDAAALIALLRAHPDVAEGSRASCQRFASLKERGPRPAVTDRSPEGRTARWRQSLEAAARERAEFPITLRWLDTGDEESFVDEEDLLCDLEDFDSTAAGHRPAHVRDARGREVHLTVRIWENVSEAWVPSD